MSKETIFKIREAEAEAERILAEAEAEAARMLADARANATRLCETTERDTSERLKEMTEQIRAKTEEHVSRVTEEANAEADALEERIKLTRKSAEKIVIGGLEAKCR